MACLLDGARTEAFARSPTGHEMGNAAARVTFGRGRGESARGARDEHAGAAAQVRRRRDGARRCRGERRVVVVQHAAQVHQVAPALQHQQQSAWLVHD